MDAITLGELLIDFVSPETDQGLADAVAFTKAPGGAPANVAVGLRRLGFDSGFIGCVGADPFGDYLAGVLAAEGVETRWLKRSHVARTTLAFVATRADGRKDITFWRHPGADTRLAPEDLDPRCFEGLRVFHFCSVSMSCEPVRSTTLMAARLAREAGALVSFDPNWRPALWTSPAEGRQWIRDGLLLADVAKVADEELELVCGTSDVDAGLDAILALGPRLAVVTLGAAGSVARSRTASVTVPGFPVTVIDPLGAGDAFVAGLLAGLLDLGGRTPREADLARLLRFANAAGALATQRVGVIPALPTTADVNFFLEATQP